MTPNKLPPLPDRVLAFLAKHDGWGNALDYVEKLEQAYAAEAIRQSQSLPAGAVAEVTAAPGGFGFKSILPFAELERTVKIGDRLWTAPGHPAVYWKGEQVSTTERLIEIVKEECGKAWDEALQADAREKGESPSLNQIPKPCAYPPVDSETGADTGSCCHHAYADGWNECRDEAIRLATQPAQASEKDDFWAIERGCAAILGGDKWASMDAISKREARQALHDALATSSQETASE